MMEGILQGISLVTVYLDNILVTGDTNQEHLQNLQEVLTWLEQAGIRLKWNKCMFLLHTVEYLGHEISEAGLKPTADKVRTLVDAPVLKDISFLGLLNYTMSSSC